MTTRSCTACSKLLITLLPRVSCQHYSGPGCDQLQIRAGDTHDYKSSIAVSAGFRKLGAAKCAASMPLGLYMHWTAKSPNLQHNKPIHRHLQGVASLG